MPYFLVSTGWWIKYLHMLEALQSLEKKGLAYLSLGFRVNA